METKERHERPRVLMLDLLESYARERDLQVRLERAKGRGFWMCILKNGRTREESACAGESARQAIMEALRQEGIEVPD